MNSRMARGPAFGRDAQTIGVAGKRNGSRRRWQSEMNAAKSGIESCKQAAEAAEDAWARHQEAGDHKAAATALRQMTTAATRAAQLEIRAEYLETEKERMLAPPPRMEAPVARQTAPQTDPISQHLSGNILPQERRWLEDRIDKFGSDSAYRAEVFAASNLAVARGYSRGSQPYFREMEKIIGEGGGAREEEPPQRAAPRQERAPSADLAPQRRAAPGAEVRGSRQFTLTADEREIADGIYGDRNRDNYIDDTAERYQHYFMNKERMKAAGRL